MYTKQTDLFFNGRKTKLKIGDIIYYDVDATAVVIVRMRNDDDHRLIGEYDNKWLYGTIQSKAHFVNLISFLSAVCDFAFKPIELSGNHLAFKFKAKTKKA